MKQPMTDKEFEIKRRMDQLEFCKIMKKAKEDDLFYLFTVKRKNRKIADHTKERIITATQTQIDEINRSISVYDKKIAYLINKINELENEL